MYSAKGLFSFSSWPFTTWSSLDLGLDAVVLARSEPFIITDSGKRNKGVKELPGTPCPSTHASHKPPRWRLATGHADLMGDSSGFQHKNLLLPGCFFLRHSAIPDSSSQKCWKQHYTSLAEAASIFHGFDPSEIV